MHNFFHTEFFVNRYTGLCMCRGKFFSFWFILFNKRTHSVSFRQVSLLGLYFSIQNLNGKNKQVTVQAAGRAYASRSLLTRDGHRAVLAVPLAEGECHTVASETALQHLLTSETPFLDIRESHQATHSAVLTESISFTYWNPLDCRLISSYQFSLFWFLPLYQQKAIGPEGESSTLWKDEQGRGGWAQWAKGRKSEKPGRMLDPYAR